MTWVAETFGPAPPEALVQDEVLVVGTRKKLRANVESDSSYI